MFSRFSFFSLTALALVAWDAQAQKPVGKISPNSALSADARNVTKKAALPSPQTVASWAFAPLATRGGEPRLIASEHATDKATRRLGLLPSSESAMRSAPQWKVRATRSLLPPQVLLTDFLPPVGDQGSIGSCAGWATAYALYTHEVGENLRQKKEDLADPRFQFSPLFIYHSRKNNKVDGGMPMSEAFEILKTKGCPKMVDYPYSLDFTSRPSPEVEAKAARYKAREVGLVFRGAIRGGEVDIEKVKTFLAERRQPIVTGISVFTDFETLSGVKPDFVYSPTNPAKDQFRGFHAVAIIGYNNAKKAIRIRNSWGTHWGDQGDLWVSEEFIKQLTLEGWSSVAGGPVARNVEKTSGKPTNKTKPGAKPVNSLPSGEGPLHLPAKISTNISLEKGS